MLNSSRRNNMMIFTPEGKKEIEGKEALALRLLQDMADNAAGERFINARGDLKSVIARMKPGEIPDHYLPGRALERMKEKMSPEEREALNHITSDNAKFLVTRWALIHI